VLGASLPPEPRLLVPFNFLFRRNKVDQKKQKLVVSSASGHRRCPGFLGGLGAKQPASKNNSSEERVDFFGKPISGSMLARHKNSRHKTDTQKYTKTNTNSNNTTPKTSKNKIYKLLLPLIIITSTSCNTTLKKQDQINHVLIKQEVLLTNLKADRTGLNLSSKIGKDQTLKESEARLLAAINALILSNQKLQKAISKKEETCE